MRKKVRFTPSPWSLDYIETSEGSYYRIFGNLKRCKLVCELPEQYGSRKYRKWNALLLKKAPNMYELLDRLVNVVRNNENDLPVEGLLMELDHIIDDAEKVLKEIRGEKTEKEHEDVKH